MRRLVLVVIALAAIVIGSSISSNVMADTGQGNENAIKAPAVSTQNSANQPGSAIANSDGSRKVIAAKQTRKSSARRTTKRTVSRANVQNVIREMGQNLKLNQREIRRLQSDRQLQRMVKGFQRQLQRSSRFQKLTSRQQTTLRKNTARRASKSIAKHRTNRTGSAVKGKATSTTRNARTAKSGKSTIAKRSRVQKRSAASRSIRAHSGKRALRNQR